MILYRVLADPERARDRPVGLSGCNEIKYLLFATGECDCGSLRSIAWKRCGRGSQVTRKQLADPGIATLAPMCEAQSGGVGVNAEADSLS